MIPDHPTDPEALRRLADAATPGPWETRGYNEMPGKYVVGPRKPGDLGRGPIVLMEPLFCDERSAADAEFIAAVREAVPALLDRIARLEAQADIRVRAVVMYRDRAREAEARIKAVERLALAADDGTEYEHNGHDPAEGEAECPGCWALGIRRALDGDA